MDDDAKLLAQDRDYAVSERCCSCSLLKFAMTRGVGKKARMSCLSGSQNYQ